MGAVPCRGRPRRGAGVPSWRGGTTVHEYALADLSPTDRTFLLAMSRDDGPSRVADIRTRMDVTANYVSVYRSRLLEAGVIAAVGHGLVDFALPYLRDYLRQHASTLVWTEPPDNPGPPESLPAGRTALSPRPGARPYSP